MPEDQGQIGDRWTEEAAILLQELGWVKVADSNIDIEGTDGHMHGIDSLYRYEDGFSPHIQGVFLEAKCYQTTSFRKGKLSDWVSCLDRKIIELRRSEEFNEIYPAMAESNPQNGLLVIWFRDTDNFKDYQPAFQEALRLVKTPRGRNANTNRLFVLTNYDILRLASLVSSIEHFNNEHKHDFVKTGLNFFYPSSVEEGLVSKESPVLNLEYIFSKFILATTQVFDHQVPIRANAVFYFGKLDIENFISLKQALLSFNIPKNHSRLRLYIYQRDDDFRKIEPDVNKLFNELENVEFELKNMDVYSDLPSWMKDY